jgi:CubicO group peptidase (beta-lactamase class C family)
LSEIPKVHGYTAPGFEPVREEFEHNFRERREVGAACAAYVANEKVVDLWGGLRDRKTRAPWEENTMVMVFSTTKGMSGLAMALAHSRGYFEYENRVAKHWPEFGQSGKQDVTIRQLLSHQAGLCCMDVPLTIENVRNQHVLPGILARQKPAWVPGTHHGYHGITLGWYEGELLRRVDPKRRSLGRFFREEIAERLGLEFTIGTPPSIPDERIATLVDFAPWQSVFNLRKLPPSFAFRVLNPLTMTAKSMRNPHVKRPSEFAMKEWREPEIPAANGIGTARSLARAYSAFANGGEELGIRPETLRALMQPAIPPSGGRFDLILRANTSYTVGFFKSSADFPCAGESAFGCPGLGGSFAYADPQNKTSFAYVMNRMDFYLWDDPRERALRRTFQRCVSSVSNRKTGSVPLAT